MTIDGVIEIPYRSASCEGADSLIILTLPWKSSEISLAIFSMALHLAQGGSLPKIFIITSIEVHW